MNQQFDIFLSHNSMDKAVIMQIKQLLRERELSAWLDEDELQPGVNWMPLLEKAICTCKSAGAFVSSNGIGPWEDEEIQALLSKAVRNRIPVIPVLLPGEYEKPELPLFLGTRTFIDMRLGVTSELLDKLEWGITGKKPQPKSKDVGLKSDLQSMSTIHIDHHPTVPSECFEGKEQLQISSTFPITNKRFLVALSFPGEKRKYVEKVADVLAETLGRGKIFYDRWYIVFSRKAATLCFECFINSIVQRNPLAHRDTYPML